MATTTKATKPRHTHIVAEEAGGRAFERIEESPIKAQTARMVIVNCGGRIIRNVYCAKPIAECRKPENLIGGTSASDDDAATYCRHNDHYCPGCSCECHTPEPTPAVPTAPCGCTFERLGDMLRVLDRCPVALALYDPADTHDFDSTWPAYNAHVDAARAALEPEPTMPTPTRHAHISRCGHAWECANLTAWHSFANCPRCGEQVPVSALADWPDELPDYRCVADGCQRVVNEAGVRCYPCAIAHGATHAAREAAQRADEAELQCLSGLGALCPRPGHEHVHCVSCLALVTDRLYCPDHQPTPPPPTTTTLPNGHERHEWTEAGTGRRVYAVEETTIVNGQRIGRQIEHGTVDAPTITARLALALTGQLPPMGGGSERYSAAEWNQILHSAVPQPSHYHEHDCAECGGIKPCSMPAPCPLLPHNVKCEHCASVAARAADEQRRREWAEREHAENDTLYSATLSMPPYSDLPPMAGGSEENHHQETKCYPTSASTTAPIAAATGATMAAAPGPLSTAAPPAACAACGTPFDYCPPDPEARAIFCRVRCWGHCPTCSRPGWSRPGAPFGIRPMAGGAEHCVYCPEPIAPGFAALCEYHLAMCIPCTDGEHARCLKTDCACRDCWFQRAQLAVAAAKAEDAACQACGAPDGGHTYNCATSWGRDTTQPEPAPTISARLALALTGQLPPMAGGSGEDCPHPPARYFAWHAYDGTLCVGCCACGAILKGALPPMAGGSIGIATAQHTPGPWALGHNYSGAVEIQGPRDAQDTCRILGGILVGTGTTLDPEGEANARLVVAAPALLEQLRQVLVRLDLEAQEQGDAAIFPCAAMRDDIRRTIAQATENR